MQRRDPALNRPRRPPDAAGRPSPRPAGASAPRLRGRGHEERRRVSGLPRGLTGGGTAGNEQLTAMAGIMLIVIFAVLGVTILRIRQLISIHLFVGLLLIGPVALKMAVTGYRFMRYYSGDAVYRHKGPPELGLRLLAPALVLATVVVFVSGVWLMFAGPAHRGGLLLIHKASFIIWLGATGLHVLAHLPRLGRSLRIGRSNASDPGVSPGSAGRWIALVGAIVGGVVLAIVLIPHFGLWTAPSAFNGHG